MFDRTLLEIQLAPCLGRPVPSELLCNSFRGGPEALLHWIETQLGLLQDTPSEANRIMEVARVLEGAERTVFANSFAVDRWGTARELLARVEQLRLAGWDGKDSPKLPPLVRDLTKAVTSSAFYYDIRSRLDRVLTAMDNGQKLPAHQLNLWNSPDSWPAAWRPILSRLTAGHSPEATPLAAPNTALQAVQWQLLRGKTEKAAPDLSLRVAKARSTQSACEAVAKSLAATPGLIPDTVILCESDSAALCLDACLAQLKLPTMGAQGVTLSHPVLQVLPLALRLCWKPVAPDLLMNFLGLPVSPIPRHAAQELASALSQQPGLGSRAWEATWTELIAPKNDKYGRNADRLTLWLEIERIPLGDPLPTELVAAVCMRTANWAAAYAANKERSEKAEPELAQALRLLASQSAVLRQLVGELEEDISEPQLVRLLESAQAHGLTVQPHIQAHGGPVLVRSLAEILQPAKRLIWLGLSTESPGACCWTAQELQALHKSGVELDDGSYALTALREAERRGFSRIQECVFFIKLPGDAESQPHPLWLQVEQVLRQKDDYPCPALEDLFDGSATDALAPWTVPSEEFTVDPPQPARPLWKIDHTLLHERDQSSASSLQDRLACPLKWVFNYQAYLRQSALTSLPDDFQLKGLFCHACLEDLFGQGSKLPSPDVAAQMIGKIFDDRLPLDAAPLAAPHREGELLVVRSQLINATKNLVAVLQAGGYRVQGMEVHTKGSSFAGHALNSIIDCLAVRDDGQEAVIDFKFMGHTKYPPLLEEGKAVQLALYAFARSQQNGGRFPSVGYLILDRGLFFTPEGSRILGDGPLTVVKGPPIREVWDSFTEAIRNGDRWIADGFVPARPLQVPGDRSEGCGMVIEGLGYGKDQADKAPCKYCIYKPLCGMEELT